MAVSDDAVLMVMNNTARVDFRAYNIKFVPKKLFKSVPLEGLPGQTQIIPVIDEATGEQAVEMEEIVEYETACGGVPNKGEARVKDLLAVDHSIDDPDRWDSNGVKQRAQMLLQQRERLLSGTQDSTPEGHLPLDKWPQITPVVVASLKFARIYSVQQLAEATEAAIQRIPSGLQPTLLRQQAITYLRQTAARALPEALLEERAKTAKLEAQMDEMRAMLDKLLSATTATGATGDEDAPKRPGRKPMPRDANGEIIREQEAA